MRIFPEHGDEEAERGAIEWSWLKPTKNSSACENKEHTAQLALIPYRCIDRIKLESK